MNGTLQAFKENQKEKTHLFQIAGWKNDLNTGLVPRQDWKTFHALHIF